MNFQWLPELRRFRKNIGSNLLIIMLLGIGLAATMVIFNFTKALVIDPLPFANAAKLERVGLVSKTDENLDEVSGLLLANWVQALFPTHAAPTGAQLFAVGQGTMNLSGAAVNGARAERYDGGFVYGPMWTGLGIKPALGRDFQSTDFAQGAPKVVIIGDKIWRQRYNAEPNILGKAVRLNGATAVIIAVMAPNMSFPRREQIWTQAALNADSTSLSVFLTRDAQFEQNLNIMQQLFLAQKKQNNDQDLDMSGYVKVGHSSLSDWVVDRQTRTLTSIMLTAVVLLLIAVCLNAASVLLVRLLAEQAQNSVRLALGSGWQPLAASALVQSLMLSLCGALLAGYLARWGGEYVLSMFDGSDEGFPGWIDIRNSAGRGYLYGFAFVCALLTAALPIWRLRSQALSGALRQGGRSVTATQGGARWLVFVQVTVSCAVVLCAGVVFQQVRAIMSHPVGVNSNQLVSGRIGLFPDRYPDFVSLQRFRTQLTEKLAQNSNLKSASLATAQPGNMGDNRQVALSGRGAEDVEDVYTGFVDERFLDTYEIPLLAGRGLSSIDMATGVAAGSSVCVALIDARLANKMGGIKTALDQQIEMNPNAPRSTGDTGDKSHRTGDTGDKSHRTGDTGDKSHRTGDTADKSGHIKCRVVGITAPFELNDLDGDHRPVMLLPISTMQLLAATEPRFLTIAARTIGAPGAFKNDLAQIVSSVDTDLPIYWLRTGAEVITATTAGNRVLATLFAGLAGIALALSAAGLYGLLAFQATQRTREIGVRLALGASTVDVWRALFGSSLGLVAIGCIVGVALAVFPATQLGSVISDTPIQYRDLIWVFAVFALTTFIAAIKPALSALTVTPQSVLKQD
jgi:putative ABC transport system permease protein